MTTPDLSPIVKTLTVRRSAPGAFEAFTREIGAWWPLDTHSRADRSAGERPVSVKMEPRVGGRIFETLADGRELDWADIFIWEPGVRVGFRWHLGRPAESATGVMVVFTPLDDGRCRITLTHSGWEALGDAADTRRNGYLTGWDRVFGTCFGTHVDGD